MTVKLNEEQVCALSRSLVMGNKCQDAIKKIEGLLKPPRQDDLISAIAKVIEGVKG